MRRNKGSIVQRKKTPALMLYIMVTSAYSEINTCSKAREDHESMIVALCSIDVEFFDKTMQRGCYILYSDSSKG